MSRPGSATRIGMIYGALKNNSPMVVTAGQQDTRIAAARSRAGPRSRGDGRAGHQVERAGRARRRARPDPAARLQDRQRGAGRPGVRGAADQRHGAGDRHSAPASPRRSSRASRPDPAGIAAMARLIARREESGDRRRRRRGARRRGQDAGEARRDASAPRCGSRACAAAIPSRPIIRPIAARSPSMRRASPGSSPSNDLVLMVGGPFFEEVWYGRRLAVPGRLQGAADRGRAAAAGLQFRGRCRRGRRRRRRPRGAVAGDDRHQRRGGAGKRNDALQAQKQADDAAQKARVEKAWSRTPTSMARVMAEMQGGVADRRRRGRRDHHGQPRPVQDLHLREAGRLLQRPRRRHRPGRGGRDRRGGGRARPADPLPLGRRLVDVFDPGAVDGGAPRPADRVRDPGQPRIPRAEAQHRRLSRALRREVATSPTCTWT